MLKTELKVETIGEPDIRDLTENERTAFLETLLARLKELKENTENHN